MKGLRINICERFKQNVTQHKKGENQRENRLGQQIILPQQSSATNPKAHCSHSSIEFWPFWSVLPSVPASPHKTQRSGWKSIKGLCYCQIIFIILLTTFRFQAGYQRARFGKREFLDFSSPCSSKTPCLPTESLFNLKCQSDLMNSVQRFIFGSNSISGISFASTGAGAHCSHPQAVFHRQQLTQNLHAHSRRVIYCLSCSHPR